MLKYEKINPPKDSTPTDKICLQCLYHYKRLDGVVCSQCNCFIDKYCWSGNISVADIGNDKYLIWYVDIDYNTALSNLKWELQNGH